MIGRSSGRSAVGAAAYRAGENITNEYDGLTHDYTRKTGVVHTEIMLTENAPKEYQDRTKLWNAVEKNESSKNSVLAREYEVALPVELSRAEQIKLVQDYVKSQFVKNGMCADVAIHDKGDGNPHAHIMLTVRPFEKDGTWGEKTKKEYILDRNGNKQYDPVKQTYKSRPIRTTNWDDKNFLIKNREKWAELCNHEFEKKNIAERIDHRTLAAQGITSRRPQIHLGAAAHQMEKRGEKTDRGNINRESRAEAMELKNNLNEAQAEYNELKEVTEKMKQERRTLEDKKREERQTAEDNKRRADQQRKNSERPPESPPQRPTSNPEPADRKQETRPGESTQHDPTSRNQRISDFSVKNTDPFDPEYSKMHREHAEQLTTWQLEKAQKNRAPEGARPDSRDRPKPIPKPAPQLQGGGGELRTGLNREILKAQSDIKNLESYQATTKGNIKKLDELRAEREKLGIFNGKEKKEIDAKIKSVNQSQAQAESALQRDYGIKPHEIDNKLGELRKDEKTLQDRKSEMPREINIDRIAADTRAIKEKNAASRGDTTRPQGTRTGRG